MRYVFGRFEADPGQRSLLVDGRPQPIRARAFDLLVTLIERSDRIVSNEELFDLVWPGLVVEESNLRQQIAALRKVIGVDALLNVPGRGYRFTPPLARIFPPAESAGLSMQGSEWIAARSAGKPSIAVLPFAALSEEPAIGFLADGLVEDVIALLARVAGFLLISSSSSFAFRETRESLSSIARRLDVRYLVEGSVRPMGDEIRVSTRLVEACSGRVLWSGSLERKRQEAEDLQEAIARGIISELEPELTRAEIELIRRRRNDDVDAWGCFHQATAVLARDGWADAALGEARRHLQLAFSIDPSFALAHAQFALLTSLGMNTGLIEASADAIHEVRGAAERALALDDGDSRVLGYAGCALADIGDARRGEDLLQSALALDPSNAQAHVALGATQALRGELDAGISAMRHGMRISPRDRRLGFWGWALGVFLLRAGHVEEALQEAKKSASLDSKLYLAPVLQTLALQSLGRTAEARQAYAAARRLRPLIGRQDVARSHGELAANRIEELGT
nr:winged helix-turn-helix domain-containing protein [uncultured Roseateles sp.]